MCVCVQTCGVWTWGETFNELCAVWQRAFVLIEWLFDCGNDSHLPTFIATPMSSSSLFSVFILCSRAFVGHFVSRIVEFSSNDKNVFYAIIQLLNMCIRVYVRLSSLAGYFFVPFSRVFTICLLSKLFRGSLAPSLSLFFSFSPFLSPPCGTVAFSFQLYIRVYNQTGILIVVLSNVMQKFV